MPSKSQCAQPQPRDIPPKTRSTPEATLVVDLVSSTLWAALLGVNTPPHTTPVSLQEETLMFSSLNVIDEAEYTFYTTFQDHQYKVTSSPAALFRSLKLHQDVFWISAKMKCA